MSQRAALNNSRVSRIATELLGLSGLAWLAYLFLEAPRMREAYAEASTAEWLAISFAEAISFPLIAFAIGFSARWIWDKSHGGSNPWRAYRTGFAFAAVMLALTSIGYWHGA